MLVLGTHVFLESFKELQEVRVFRQELKHLTAPVLRFLDLACGVGQHSERTLGGHQFVVINLDALVRRRSHVSAQDAEKVGHRVDWSVREYSSAAPRSA